MKGNKVLTIVASFSLLFSLSGCTFLGYSITPVNMKNQASQSTSQTHRSIFKRQIPLSIDKKIYTPSGAFGQVTIKGVTAPNSTIDYNYGIKNPMIPLLKADKTGKFKLQLEAMAKDHQITITAQNKNYNSAKISAKIIGQTPLMPYNDFYTAYVNSPTGPSSIPITIEPPLSGQLNTNDDRQDDSYITFEGNIDQNTKDLMAVYISLQKYNGSDLANNEDITAFTWTVETVGSVLGFQQDVLDNTVQKIQDNKSIGDQFSGSVIMKVENTKKAINVSFYQEN